MWSDSLMWEWRPDEGLAAGRGSGGLMREWQSDMGVAV